MSTENTPEQSNEHNLTLYTDTLDSVPESLHSFYEKEEDGYKLKIKNVVPSAKLDEFRTNNRKLNSELEEMRKQMSYVDMDEYNKLKEQYSKDKAKGSIPETDVEQTLAKRTAEMKADFEKKLAEMTENYSKTSQKLSTVLIDNQVQSSAAKHNVKQSAFEDVLLRAKNTFSLEDGKAIAKDDKGETIYNNEGEPMTIDQWIGKLQKTAGHLFEESTGGGARGQRSPVQAQPKQLSARDMIAQGLRGN